MIRPFSIRNQCWVYRDEYRVIGKDHLQFARSNAYPYSEHVRDCDICLAAQAVESLQAEVDKYKATCMTDDIIIARLQAELEKLKRSEQTEKDGIPEPLRSGMDGQGHAVKPKEKE